MSDISFKVYPMRRLMYFLILVLVVGASATCVSASTDCERWFAAYRSELLHNQQVQRIAAAKRRAKLYAQRKISGYVQPKPAAKPTPKLVRTHVPRMNRQDALHHFDLACGVLPESATELPLISEETPAGFGSGEDPSGDEIGLLPGFDGPGSLLPEDTPPPPTFSQSPPSGGPPIFQPPFTGGGGGGGGTPPPPPPPVPVLPAVPEPSSIVFLLTGCVGAAGAIRRRWKA